MNIKKVGDFIWIGVEEFEKLLHMASYTTVKGMDKDLLTNCKMVHGGMDSSLTAVKEKEIVHDKSQGHKYKLGPGEVVHDTGQCEAMTRNGTRCKKRTVKWDYDKEKWVCATHVTKEKK